VLRSIRHDRRHRQPSRAFRSLARPLVNVATCPDCGAYLSDDHHCRGRAKRRRQSIIVGTVGALVGLIVPAVLWPTYSGHPWLIGAMMTALGAFTALSVLRAIRGPR
jgi:hypothetical protein